MGHTVTEGGNQGVAEVIVFNQKDGLLEGGLDRRAPDGGAPEVISGSGLPAELGLEAGGWGLGLGLRLEV
jgi:hypothetical protein